MEDYMSLNYQKLDSTGNWGFFESKLKEALFDSHAYNDENFVAEAEMWLRFHIGFDWYVDELTIFEAQSDFNLGLLIFTKYVNQI